MIRALTLTCLVLVGLSATALAKPKIAVLGLEPQDPSATAVAKELTDALRLQAKASSGKYEYVGPDKELVDEKLNQVCDTELPACMSPIGASIGASRLLYGHVRKVEGNFIVDLVLLNVDGKSREKSFANQRISLSDAAEAGKSGTFAKNLYRSITGEVSTGTLVVEVSNKDVDKGAVKVDGEPKGYLSGGRLTVQGLPDGKHTLTVDVGGFQPFSKEVTIVANDRISASVTMTAEGGGIDTHETFGTESQGSKTNYWKPMFVAGSILAAAGGAFWVYSYMKETGADGMGKINLFVYDDKGGKHEAGPDDCNGNSPSNYTSIFPDSPANGNPDPNYAMNRDQSREGLASACKYRGWTKAGIAATAIGGVIMLGTFYSAWLKEDKEKPDGRTVGRQKKKSNVSVTPVISPNGGFATLRIDW